jgi:type I restriction-modification system DNA methylase subunit
MSKQYICELCNKIFNQKIDFTRHQNKKAPCISIDKIQQLGQTKEIKNNFKDELKKLFNYCLDILRNSEHLTGDKALRSLAHLLDLRLLEPQFGKQIDIDNYDKYIFEYYDKAKLLSIARFSNLVKEKEENIPQLMKFLWDDILSVNPITKNIFLKGKGFDIQHQSTYKKIIDKLYTFDFEAIDEDVLGEAYEEVIKDIMTGKVLGQFFTPPIIKKMMIKIIDPQLKSDGTIETIFDPAMGTGGFLISSLRHLLQQSKSKKIKIDWDFISNKGLGGREAEPDTYQLAISNMLISSGKMFDVLEKGDSIRNPITQKYDIVLANPPFGIDGLIYNEILHPLRNEYMPIKSNSAVPLFLQAIIYILNINGRCAVVLPNGKELFSKNNELVAIREYLMKTCDLKEIYYLPPVFTHTPISTCVFHFVKKRNGYNDAVKVKVKISKIQKEIGREYEFSKTHQTTKISFYNYNPENEMKHLLIEVPIEEISKNKYSLNYMEYMKDEINEDQFEEDIIVKTLEEICNFLPKSKRQASYGEKEGKYPFYTSSQTCNKYCDEFDFEDECLIIGTGGNANIKYSSKFSCSTDNFVIKINSEYLIKYIYYYILHHIEILQKGFVGVGLQHISKEYVNNIKIPFPSLKKQQQIIKYLDFIYDKCIKTTNEKILELKQLNEYCLNNQTLFGKNIINSLNDLGIFLPKSKRQASYGEKEGKYPFYTSSQTCNKYCDEYDYEEQCLIIGTGGNANIKYSSKFSCSTDNLIIKINEKYIYYYLLNNIEVLQKGFMGVGLQHISKEYVSNIKIPLPSPQKQQEIIKYCEDNDNLIKKLENEIEENKIQANIFLSQIIKSIDLTTDSYLSDTESIKSTESVKIKKIPKDILVV